MSDEIKPIISTEGKPVDGMTVEEAQTEYNEMSRDKRFLGEQGNYSHQARQQMMNRRMDLYRKGFPKKVAEAAEMDQAENKALFAELKKHGVTEETLEKDAEACDKRDDEEAMAKARRELESHFGGEEEAERALGDAKDILKRFAKPADLQFLEESGLGSDPEFIRKLSELQEILKRVGRKGR